MERKQQGTCKFYQDEKGYGFISAEDGKEYFFHVSGLVDQAPKKGDRVSFNLITASRGPKAVDVCVAS